MYDTSDPLLARRINVGDISHRGARRHPNKLALVMGERRLTYRELDEASSRLANGMIAAGYGAGTRVAILARNSPEFFIVYFAAAKAGAVF